MVVDVHILLGGLRLEILHILCPKIFSEALENVSAMRDRLKIGYSWQKSNVHNRRRDLKFEVGDMVYLKIAPMKGMMRFVKKGKLIPRFVGPCEVL